MSFLAGLEALPWMEEGVCRDYGTPDDWFDSGEFLPSRGYNAATRRAVAICETCPVKAECAAYALDNDEIYGVWGGLTPHARKVIRARRRREEGAA